MNTTPECSIYGKLTKLPPIDFNTQFTNSLQALTFLPKENEAFNHSQLFSSLELFLKNELHLQKVQLESDLQYIKNQVSEHALSKQFKSQVNSDLVQAQQNLSQLEGKHLPLTDLLKVLGRGEFRDYILTSIENYLIYLANRELSAFCQGRYRLKSVSTSHGHEIFVEDTFFIKGQSSHYRKMASLSGGETFLVGLALALGLSELFVGNAEIESFFIDEGLGSLDADSLQETLEGLQLLASKGKQVGIISHIPSLNEQLPAHFQISKNAKGNSQIEVHYN